MGLESGTYVSDLVAANPVGTTDSVSQGDDHIRLIKSVLKNTFPSASKAFYFPTALVRTSNYTVVAADQNKTFIVDASGGAVSLTLPSLTSADAGWRIGVIKSDASANSVTVVGTINGASNYVISTRYVYAEVFWSGSAWYASGAIADNSISTSKIANDAVTYAKMQNVSATARILGRKSTGAGDPEECTLSEVLDFIGSAAQGDILYRGASGWQRLPAGSANNVLLSGGASANPSWGDVFVHGSAVSLSGTSVVLTGISPRAKIVDVYVYDAVYNADTRLAFQLGTSSGIEASGYTSISTFITSGVGVGAGYSATTAFISTFNGGNTAYFGRVRFTNITGGIWGADAMFGIVAGTRTAWIAGGKGLSGTLDRIRVTTESGTASFTSGYVVVSQILA